MHIFISYAKKDTRQLTETLAHKLEEQDGVTVWWDDSILPGNSWSAQIEQEIDRADLFIVLLSPDVRRSSDSQGGGSFVVNEINYAQAQSKPILPVMAQPINMPVQLAALQYIDLTQNKQVGIAQIIAYVNEMARQQTNPHEAPTLMMQAAQSTTQTNKQRNWKLWAGVGALVLIVGLIGLDFALFSGSENSKDDSPQPSAINAVAQNSSPDDMTIDSSPEITQVATTEDNQLDIADVAATDDANASATAIIIATLTAIEWTATPEQNRTAEMATFRAGQTEQAVVDQTASATLWTPTLTATHTATDIPSPTPSNTPTFTLTPSPTNTPIPAGYRGGANITANNQWTPITDNSTQNGYPVSMVLVPKGCFTIGTASGNSNEPPQSICFTEPFWIDQYEVSNEQFNALGGQASQSSSTTTGNHPRESIS